MTQRQKSLISISSLVILSLFFLILLGDNGIIDLNRLKNQRDALVEKNTKIKEEIALLSIEIDRVKNDPAYIEAVARQELGMIGKDEVILKFDEEQETENE